MTREDGAKMGRRPNPRNLSLEAYMARFRISYRHPAREIPMSVVDQLDACADDSARRLLLGKSEQMDEV